MCHEHVPRSLFSSTTSQGDRFDVAPDQARADVRAFVAELAGPNLLQVASAGSGRAGAR